MEVNSMVKVFRSEGYTNGTISETEAKSEGIETADLPLASIEDCKKQVVDGNIAFAYWGKIEVIEGIFEFNFDTGKYDKI